MHIVPVVSSYSSHMFSPSCLCLSPIFRCFLPPQPPFSLHLVTATQSHVHPHQAALPRTHSFSTFIGFSSHILSSCCYQTASRLCGPRRRYARARVRWHLELELASINPWIMLAKSSSQGSSGLAFKIGYIYV